jgi:hypothetical protein
VRNGEGQQQFTRRTDEASQSWVALLAAVS